MYNNDPIMRVIDTCLPYKDRRVVINVMAESAIMRESVYGNIGSYFTKFIESMNIEKSVTGFNACNGDITKAKHYKALSDTVESLKHDTNPYVAKAAMVVEQAITNIKKYTKLFVLGCKTTGSKMIKCIFGAIHKLIVGATSLLVSDSGTANGEGKAFAQDKNVPLAGLEIFNEYCNNGTLDKVLRSDLGLGKQVKEDWVSFAALANIGSAFITAIRSAIYWVYYARMDLADYLEQQAAYLELNRMRLEKRTDISEEKKKEILAKQAKWQERLLSLSDKIQLDDIKAAKQAKEKAKKEEKDIKASDCTGNECPDFF